MKVGMYNRWLATLGGGEKYSLAIAAYLSQNHDVHVISHQKVSKEEAASRLNLDLDRVQFDVIPSRSSIELKPITGEFDLFINASFMEFLPSIAPKSVAIIYFPAPLEGGGHPRLRYRLGWAMKRWFMIPTLEEGFVRIKSSAGRRNIIEANPRARLKLPLSSKPYHLSFELASQAPEKQAVDLILDGRVIDRVLLGGKGELIPVGVNVPGSPNRVRELVIEPVGVDPDSSQQPCLDLAQVRVMTPRNGLFRAAFGSLLGAYGVRFQLLPLQHSSILDQMVTYDSLWAISEYTRQWIETYWGIESPILYPPVDVEKFTPKPKKNQILNVGRFFAGDHNKKHLVMIAAFKEMVDAGLKGWEFHLAGGTTPGDVHQKYLSDVIEQAAGYPITIHPDLPYPQLLELYNQSAIYWHASGYGEDENRDPVKFEHFGITTVEGMAAGCVPVVIGKGGQIEIVHHGQDGFLWYSTAQLKSLSSNLIENPGLRQKLAANAVISSRNFSLSKFYQRVHALLAMIDVKE